MKSKLLLMLCLVLVGISSWASEAQKKRATAHINVQGKVMTRSLFNPSVCAEDKNDCLYLTFQFSLANADIVITDKNGNEVVNEQQTLIYEGKVIAISPSDGYPYAIEITSSTVDITGEVVLIEE